MSDRDSAARLYRHSWREAIVVMIVWALALVWTVGYCYLRGYSHPADSWLVKAGLAEVRDAANLRTFLGLPDWVAIGILLPWLLCTAFTFIYSLYGMKDDDLGTEAGEGPGHGH